jgi:glycosyltransferase involved in cell wall biosynthesis
MAQRAGGACSLALGGCMADQPLVSILTPFLNAEQTLQEAIQSALAQTYEQWELLLVDDGSTDASAAIARTASADHSTRIRYLAHQGHENLGQAASRNLALLHARGEYVALLDADDVWLPHKLEHQVAVLQANPDAGLLMAASLYWYSWTGRTSDLERDKLIPVGGPQDALIHPPELLTMLYPLGRGASPCTGSLLLRRSTLEAVGGFEEGFRGIFGVYEDQALFTKLYLVAPAWISSMCCDKYRQHSGSCVATTRELGHYHLVRRYFLHWFERYLLDCGEITPDVWQALEHALARYRRPVRHLMMELRVNPTQAIREIAKEIAQRTLPVSMYASLRRRAGEQMR